MPPSQRRRPKDRKATIALAAAELFCARGFHNVGIEDIAGAVGITGPAIYRHFPTKQAVLAAAVEELATAFADAVTSADGLDDALAAILRYTLDRRWAARLYQWEGRHLPAEDGPRLAERFDSAVHTLRDRLLASRPALSKLDAATLVNAALSVIASPSTHRVSLSRASVERVLTRGVRAVLTAELPAPHGTAPRDHDPARLALLPRRERLLAEAVRLFCERGYHEVGIADIGEAAGINASSVYSHFAGKADLLAAALYRATSRLEVATTEALVEAATPAQALRRLVETYVRIAFDGADLAAVYVSESENLSAADRHRLRVAQRRHVDTWVGLVTELDGREPPAAVRFLVHAALNVVTDLARSRSASVTEERATAVVTALLRNR